MAMDLIVATSQLDMERQVNAAIAAGFCPIGGITISGTRMYQEMTSSAAPITTPYKIINASSQLEFENTATALHTANPKMLALGDLIVTSNGYFQAFGEERPQGGCTTVIATNTTLGSVKGGGNITVAGDGTLNAPLADANTYGLIKPHYGLYVDPVLGLDVVGTYVTHLTNQTADLSVKPGVNPIHVLNDINVTLVHSDNGLPVMGDVWHIVNVNSSTGNLILKNVNTTYPFAIGDITIPPGQWVFVAASNVGGAPYVIHRGFMSTIATDTIVGVVKGSSEVPVAADGTMSVGVLPYLNINDTTANRTKLWLSKYTSGTGHTDAPAAGSAESQYISLGGREYGVGKEIGIGMGYTADNTQLHPIFIGYHETSATGNNYGDMVFKTRNVTTNTAPTERFSITAAGDLLAATGYTPATDQSLTTKKYVDDNTLTRIKSECWFTGLSLAIPTVTPTNLITLIKSLTHTGSLAPFFNTTTDKFNVSNYNTSVNFKINLIGTWSGATTNRSVTVDFPQTNGNSLTKTRDAAVTSDEVSMSTFFSVDLNGNLATNGSDITVVSNGATFTVNSILLIAEQLIPTSGV